jgi:hypothetical protein
MRLALILVLVVLGSAGIWFIGQLPAFRREQVPGVSLTDLRDRATFTARVDAVRYGPQSTNKEATYDYIIVFITKPDGGKLGVIDHTPDLHVLESIRSLKVGNDYQFPEVLLRTELKEHPGERRL